MSDAWFYAKDEKPIGPVDLAGLRAAILRSEHAEEVLPRTRPALAEDAEGALVHVVEGEERLLADLVEVAIVGRNGMHPNEEVAPERGALCIGPGDGAARATSGGGNVGPW